MTNNPTSLIELLSHLRDEKNGTGFHASSQSVEDLESFKLTIDCVKTAYDKGYVKAYMERLATGALRKGYIYGIDSRGITDEGIQYLVEVE